MKNIKIWFGVFVLFTVVWFSSMGCANRGSYHSSPPTTKVYKEQWISFSINEKKDELLLIGKQYNYTIYHAHELIYLLKAKKLLKFTQNNMNIYVKNTFYNKDILNLNMYIYFPINKCTKEQITWLTNHNYTKQSSYTMMYAKQVDLKGKRYHSTINSPIKTIPLTPPINLSINERI